MEFDSKADKSFEMAINVNSSVVYITIAFFAIGLTNGTIFCPEEIPSVICDCHKNTTTSITVRCKNRDLKEYFEFGQTKVCAGAGVERIFSSHILRNFSNRSFGFSRNGYDYWTCPLID